MTPYYPFVPAGVHKVAPSPLALPPFHYRLTMPEIQSGETYKITNVKGGTIVDLSGADNKSSQYIIHEMQLR